MQIDMDGTAVPVNSFGRVEVYPLLHFPKAALAADVLRSPWSAQTRSITLQMRCAGRKHHGKGHPSASVVLRMWWRQRW